MAELVGLNLIISESNTRTALMMNDALWIREFKTHKIAQITRKL